MGDADLLREGMHQCPAHPDRGPSLSVTRAADGRWLLHCHAGCETAAVLRAAGLEWADLFPDGRRPTGRTWLPAPADDPAALLSGMVRALEVARLRRRPWVPVFWAADTSRALSSQARIYRKLATGLGD